VDQLLKLVVVVVVVVILVMNCLPFFLEVFVFILAQNKDAGNLTDRIELRKRLNCKSFKWFLDNVFPEKFIVDEDVYAYGMVSFAVS